MKYKSIILILSIFILFSIASVSTGEVDDKVMMSDENAENRINIYRKGFENNG